MATLLSVFSLALGLEGLPRDLLHNIGALLSGGRSTLPGTNIGTLLVIHILGYRGRNVFTNFLGHIIAHLARLIDVIADLLGNGLTDIPLSCSALTVAHFLGLYGWDQ